MKKKLLSTLLAVLLVLTAIPFTVIPASAVTQEFTHYTIAGQRLLDFEHPYDPEGNYTISGFLFSNTTFKGTNVKLIERTDDVVCYREEPYSIKTEFTPNLYNYSTSTSDDGVKLLQKHARYLTVDYYYDTTGRDPDSGGVSLEGRTISLSQWKYQVPGETEPRGIGWTRDARTSIVANKWDTAVIDLCNANPSQFAAAVSSNAYFHQYALKILGNASNPIMYKGDKFYIKQLNFYSYDPDDVPDEERNINFYTSDDATSPEFTYTKKDFKTFTVPNLTFDYPSGETFLAGWRDEADGKVYIPGDSFVLNNGADINLRAQYSSSKVYLSASGEIEGVDGPVYTTFAAADAALKELGGKGTIIVDGAITTPNSVNLQSQNILVKGYDSEAVFNLCVGVPHSFYGTGMIKFDDIIIKRADTSSDENYLSFKGLNAEFGPGCTFQKGKLGETTTMMNLYFGIQDGANIGRTSRVTVNSPIAFAHFATCGGWGHYGTVNGDFEYNINDGTYSAFFLGSRNGRGDTNQKYVINGDVVANISGGSVGTPYIGSNNPADINGNAVINVSGGTFSGIMIGDYSGFSVGSIVSNIRNFAVVVNTKEFLDYEGNTAVPAISRAPKHPVSTNGVIVLNNAELTTARYSAELLEDAANKYNVSVIKGKAEPVFDGTNTPKFAFTSDDPSKTDVFANETKLIPDEGGLYTLTTGTTEIVFATPGNTVYALNASYGGENVKIGGFEENSILNLPLDSPITSAPAGKIFDGYEYHGTIYNPGDEFTMPAEATTVSVRYVENAENKYYVASTGNDSYSGCRSTAPFATVKKAQAAIGGGNTGTVVFMDTVNNSPDFTMSGHFTFTGKDGDTIYPNAAFVRKPLHNERFIVSNGWYTLDHIKAVNDGSGEANTPYRVQSGTIEFGEGYVIKTTAGVQAYGDEMKPESSNGDKTIIINNKSQFIDLLDWGTHTIGNTLRIIVNENGSFSSGNQISLGGDSGSAACTATVQNPMFISVFNNQNSVKVKRGGFKVNSKTVLNGLQVLFVNSNAVIENASTGTYTNNGAEYIVNVPACPDDVTVTSTSFGKINIATSNDYTVTVTDANGTRTLESLDEVTLAAGSTDISFTSNATITIKYDGVEEANTEVGATAYTILDKSAGDYQVAYYTYNGKKYYPGQVITLPSVDTEIDFISCKINKNNPTIYIDTENGNDANGGFVSDDAFKTLAAASSVAASFDSATINISGTVSDNYLTFPAMNGVLTVKGGKLLGTNAITFKSDFILENTSVGIQNQYKQLATSGKNFTIGEGVTIASENFGDAITVHAGVQNANETGNMNIVLKSGKWALQCGPYYNSEKRTMTGDIDITVDGATVTSIQTGDGYDPPNKHFDMTGNFTVTVNSGTLGTFNPFAYADTITSNACYNYTANAVKAGNKAYVFNFKDGITGTFAGGSLTVSADANANRKYPSVANVITIPEAGKYKISAGKNVDTEYGKNSAFWVEGVQMRIKDNGGSAEKALRFVVNFDKEAIKEAYPGLSDTETAAFGYAVLPTEYIPSGEKLSYNSEFGGKQAASALITKLWDTTHYTVCITGITEAKYDRAYTIVPYFVIDGVYYYGESYSCSLYALASDIKTKHIGEEIIITPEQFNIVREIINAVDIQ